MDLIFLPRWRWSSRLIAPVLPPALLAALYSVLAVTQFGRSPGGFSSLASVALLFQTAECYWPDGSIIWLLISSSGVGKFEIPNVSASHITWLSHASS